MLTFELQTRLRNAALQIIDCLLAHQWGSSRKSTRICCIENSKKWRLPERGLIHRL